MDATKTLKIFDIDGMAKQSIRDHHDVFQLVCFEEEPLNVLVLKTSSYNLELRDVKDPSILLDAMYSPQGYEDPSLCKTSATTFLLATWEDKPSTAAEYEIIGDKFGKLKREINIPLKHVYGMTTVSHDDKKLLVMTSWKEQTILALDYNTLDEVWRLEDVECDGEVIHPHGICSDGAGHLFVADGTNERILTVNADGTGLRKLTDTENNVSKIVWIAP